MKTFIIALLALAPCLLFGHVGKVISAGAAEISYEGRTLVQAEGVVRLGYAGIVTRIHFSGSTLTCKARTTSEELYLDVVVDGGAPSFLKIAKGEGEYVLTPKQAAGEHRVEITKRVEGSVGILDILSFGTEGDFLAADPLPGRRLLFLGDSFTSGQATTVEEGGLMDPRKAMRQNGRLCYGRLLGSRLHAQSHIIACAGKGVFRDWQGVRNTRLAPDYYENALPDDDNSKWDPRTYVPDAIGVCLGNNDFDEGIPDQTEYIQRYMEFVRKLRRDAPEAHIFLITSPSLVDAPGGVPKRSVQKAYFEEIARRLSDPKVHVIQIAQHDGVPGDWHPSGTAHRAVAGELEPVFRSVLEWNP